MQWILDLDILLLVCGIARKHGIVPKTIFGAPQYFPPKKFYFLLRTREFLRKRVCGFSNWRLQEFFFNRANLFGGAIFMFPPIHLLRMGWRNTGEDTICISLFAFVELSYQSQL
jgi:hypothetical protein